MSSPSVIIVGAGPVGLTAALGLHQGGIAARDIVVADERPSRDLTRTWSKSVSMSASSLEIFRTLGIDAPFVQAGRQLSVQHFGSGAQLLHLNYDVLGTKYPFNMALPQVRTEAILLGRCEELGIRFAWGRRLTGLAQTDSAVSATFQAADTTDTMAAPWLIGCDGTRSAVRQAAGFTWEGTKATHHIWIADGQCGPETPAMMALRNEHGKCLILANGNGPAGRRFCGVSPPSASADGRRPSPPAEAEVRHWALAAFGNHYNFHGLTWSTVVGDGMCVADSLRRGRVFIAGDAAHQLFPSGGQGMNTGLLDAANLGWKLAAVATGRFGTDKAAGDRVLDSYSAERQPAAQAVAQNIRLQMQIIFDDTEAEQAVTAFLTEALGEPALNKKWARRVTGFGDPVAPYHVAYPSPGAAHATVGTRLTHVADEAADALVEAAHKGVFVLAAVGGRPAGAARRFDKFKEAVQAGDYGGRVTIHEAPVATTGDKWDSVSALLVRPDLRVAWVARNEADVEESRANLQGVLDWWFGRPRPL